MAADVAEAPKAHAEQHDSSSAGKGKSKKKLLIGAIVLVVVLVQGVVTYLLIPHASSSDAGHKPAEKEHGAAAAHEPDHGHHGHDAEPHEGDVAEVSLGNFSFSNGVAVPGVILHVDFKLTAITAAKQAASLESQVKVHDARIRQAVNKIVRGSNLEELNDPNMHAIKRSIREEVNRLLRKSYVNEVVITDIRTIEQ